MIEPRFAPGDRVHVDTRLAERHCRTPFYLRGRTGVVEAVHGRFRDPDRLAFHRPGLPKHYLYRVRFDQVSVWGEAAENSADVVVADLFEHWLTKASPGETAHAK